VASTDPLHDSLADAGERFALHLRADDAARASLAMQAVAEAVGSLTPVPDADAPRTSALGPVLGGLLLRIDELSTRVDTRRRLAGSIRHALAEAGLPDAPVSVLAVDGLRDLDECRRAVVLRMFPPPAGSAGRLDPAWIDVAAEWVFGDQRPDADVRLRVLGVEFSVRAAEAAGVLHGCAAARAWCDVITGDVKSRLRTASISFGAAPHVSIAGGGPRCDDDGLVARFDLLAEVAKELAHECAYACLDFEETFGELGNGLVNSDWALEGGAAPNTIAGRLCDRYVPDAYGHQIIGPKHVDRLLEDDPGRAWGEPLPGNRRELRIGDPVDWLLSSEIRGDVRADGWDLLGSLLLREGELDAALADSSPARTSGQASDGVAAARNGVPEFDSIVIDAEQHGRRGTRLTVLELAAWLGGEAHTDEPRSVSPVLRLFVRHLARGLDDPRRQQLKPVAPRLVGTDRGAEDERRRAWELTDWLVRVHAPPWLRRAGLTESADRLDGLDSITGTTDLVRAVDLLGNAIVTASRRLEITTTIAGERAELVDQIAWEVWETAAERTGWMAASEAVLYEIPSDLAFAADARVIECSRDPRIRTELEASTHGLGDAIWAAALQEIAAAAWHGAWEATESFVHHESTFSIGTALRRSLESELAARAGGTTGDGTGDTLDDMGVDLLLDEVDAAVRDALAHLVLAEDDDVDFWQRAVDAASEGERGKLWRRALDGTRGVLGAVLFDDAIDVARTELHRWLDEAPRMVGRAVAAAVAREACGVAGRGIAARAAAETLARGGTDEDAEQSAWQVISGIVEDLADDSLRMVEVLVEPAQDPLHAPAHDEAASPV
jgi:hypothetical protein